MRTAIKRTLAISTVGAFLALGATGCDSTELSGSERAQAISRTWNVEGRQLVDDTDMLLMLRPPSRLTPWHVR